MRCCGRAPIFCIISAHTLTRTLLRPDSVVQVDLDYVGIKAPQFSFSRLQGSDPTLGVEMMSTGMSMTALS